MSLEWLTPETIQLLWQGIILTVGLTFFTSIFSLVVGILMGTLRLAGSRVWRGVAAIYVAIHRNSPALVLVIFWAFAFPNLFPLEQRQFLFFNNAFMEGISQLTGLSLPYYALAATLALTLNTSAYIAELFRAGVGSIAQEHLDAARSLGASPRALFWHILLPQGVRVAFPAISTRLIHNMKNTALAAFVSVPEFFHSTQTAISRTFRAIEFLLLAAAVYLALSFLFAALLRWIDEQLN
ncbi:MAG: amino acid ABC transporter permease [Ardenticatenaceae bacterium]